MRKSKQLIIELKYKHILHYLFISVVEKRETERKRIGGTNWTDPSRNYPQWCPTWRSRHVEWTKQPFCASPPMHCDWSMVSYIHISYLSKCLVILYKKKLLQPLATVWCSSDHRSRTPWWTCWTASFSHSPAMATYCWSRPALNSIWATVSRICMVRALCRSRIPRTRTCSNSSWSPPSWRTSSTLMAIRMRKVSPASGAKPRRMPSIASCARIDAVFAWGWSKI